MKKILIVGNNDGGLYLFRAELIKKMLDEGFEVHFTVPYGEKVESLKTMGAIYHEIDVDRRGMNPIKDLKLIFDYKRLFNHLEPDVVLTYTVKPNAYAGLVARYMGIPCIATITGLGSSLQGEDLKAKIIKLLYKTGLKGANFVFFQNVQNKAFFLENQLVEEKKIRFVKGSGVNTQKFYPQREYHTGVNFLFISRIMKEKGAEEYMEAARRLKSQYPYANFQMLGFYDEDCLKEKVNEGVGKGFLQYIGVSADTRKEMAQADCIVLPSYHEGMSNVLLEGASFGLPLITSDIHGCKEAVEDEVTGFLCMPKDAQSLADTIERFLSLSPEKRAEMGIKGRQKMQSEFDRELVVGEYMKAIKGII